MSDPFLEVAGLLFGSGADELVAKMNPVGSDLSAAQKDQRKRKITAGLSAVGAAAGGAGLALGTHNIRRGYKTARAAQKADMMFHAPGAKKKAFKTAIGHEKLATGLIPLEVAGLTGEVAATKILHSDTKKKPGTLVKKDVGDLLNNSSEIPTSKGKLTMAVLKNPKAQKKGMEYTKQTAGMLRKLPNKVTTTNEVEKSEGASRDEIDSSGRATSPRRTWTSSRSSAGPAWWRSTVSRWWTCRATASPPTRWRRPATST